MAYKIGDDKPIPEKTKGFTQYNTKYPWHIKPGQHFVVTDKSYQFMMYTVGKRNQREKKRGTGVVYRAGADDKNPNAVIVWRVS